MLSEDSIRDIVCNELSFYGHNKPTWREPAAYVSLVGSKSRGKHSGKLCKSRPEQQQCQTVYPISIVVKKCPGKRFWPCKIGRHRSCEKWLFKIAKRPLHHLVPQNSEIHNFTSVKLSERQSRVLDFTTFTTSPKWNQFHLQIQDFCWRVRLQDKFANSPQDTDFNPRLYVLKNIVFKIFVFKFMHRKVVRIKGTFFC